MPHAALLFLHDSLGAPLRQQYAHSLRRRRGGGGSGCPRGPAALEAGGDAALAALGSLDLDYELGVDDLEVRLCAAAAESAEIHQQCCAQSEAPASEPTADSAHAERNAAPNPSGDGTDRR